jgi:hypothetical protein
MPRGGARPGAGRKKNADKYAAAIERFTDKAAKGLTARYTALDRLAKGGFEQVTETWEPAGLIYVSKQIETSQGAIRVSELAFPELPPEQLVCVRRTRSVAAPDRKANEYLVDRVLGRPTQQLDVDSDPDGSLDVTAEAMRQATSELQQWRQHMTEQLSSLSVGPTPPTPATTTG